jgi:tripartite-type tricarboxylate transporter receptor subunit TctC
MRTLVTLCAIAFASSTLLPGSAGAQADYPTRTIRVLVPFAPGGVADMVGRIAADELKEGLGATVVVENKPGGTGLIATQEVMKSPPDGYTLLIGTIANLIVPPELNPNAKFDALNDITPLSIPAQYPLLLLVNPATPVAKPGELASYARSKANGLSFGSAGVGALNFLSMHLLMQATGLDFVHIPFRGGPAASMELLSGNIDVLFEGLPAVAGLLEGQKLKPIAVTSEARLETLPEVPTMAESGYPNFVISGWIGVFGPPNMPPNVREKLDGVLGKMGANPAVQERLKKIGFTAIESDTKAAGDFYALEARRWKELIKQRGIKAQ